MRWIRGHWVGIALLTVIVAVLGLEAMGAVASPRPARGNVYEGSGRQPHFSKGSFLVQFRVARNGRRITQLNVWNLHAACGRGRDYYQPSFGVGSAQIRRDGIFKAVWRDNVSGWPPPGSLITLTGRFLNHGRASGTLRVRGRQTWKGCNADGIWTAHVKPPPPPVQHFTGTTDKGTRVTFQRTIERHPRVTRFTFDSLRTRCGFTVTATTGHTNFPPYNEFALPVVHGRFSGDYMSRMADFYIRISGRFDAKDQASGTVLYGDRGDCMTGRIHWTAHRAGRNK